MLRVAFYNRVFIIFSLMVAKGSLSLNRKTSGTAGGYLFGR